MLFLKRNENVLNNAFMYYIDDSDNESRSNHGQFKLMGRVFATIWNNGWDIDYHLDESSLVHNIALVTPSACDVAAQCAIYINRFVSKFGGNEFMHVMNFHFHTLRGDENKKFEPSELIKSKLVSLI